MEKLTMITLTNAKPGREAEFEDWYDNQHIPDLLRLPGVLSATRYRVGPAPGAPARPAWQFALTMDIDAARMEEATQAMAKASRTPAMPISDALATATVMRLVLRPVK